MDVEWGKGKEKSGGDSKGRGKGREMKQGTGGEALNGHRNKVAWLIDLRKHNECQKVAVLSFGTYQTAAERMSGFQTPTKLTRTSARLHPRVPIKESFVGHLPLGGRSR